MQKAQHSNPGSHYHIEKGLVLSKFFESAPMMMGVADVVENDIVHVSDNEASATFFGKSAEALVGKRASEIGVSREHIDLWISHYRKAQETKRPVHFEYLYSDQTRRYLSVTVSFIEISNEGNPRFSYIVDDITEMREAQEKLRLLNEELEERISARTRELQIEKTKLASLLKSSPVGIAFLDNDLKYEIINPVLAELNGKTPEEHIGKSVRDILPESADNLIPNLKMVLEKKDRIMNWEHDAVINSDIENPRNFLSNYFPVEIEGEIIGVGGIVVDMTFKKQSENELKKNELRYRTVVEGVKDYGIIRFDKNGDILDWNSGAQNIFKYSRDEILGKSGEIIFTPEDIQQGVPEEEMRLAIANGSAPDKRWHVKKDGSRFYANGSMNVLKNDAGSVIGFIKVLRDDTSLHETEIIRERFFNLPDLMLSVSGADGYYKRVNKAFEATLGYTKEELLSRTWLSFVHPDDVDSTMETGLKLMKGEMVVSFQNRIRCSDGSYKWLLWTTWPIDNEYYSFARDITLLKEATEQVRESEERFRGLANALPQIIWTATPDFFVDWYNDWWFEYLGLPRGTVWNDPETSPMHPDDVERTLIKIQETIISEEDFEMEQRFRRGSDGQYRWHLVRGRPVRNSEGKIIKWVGANTDIHDQKLILDELQSERVIRDRFVAALSHDLRTPLTAAKMSAQIIARKPNDPDVILKSSARIVDNMNRADQMIRDLLDVNRIKAGEKLPIEVNQCLLNKVVEETLDDLIAVHGDRFQFKFSEEISGQWSCNSIRRILENLCNNAIKYGSSTSPVTISVDEVDKCAVIKVHNEGRPIPHDEKVRLFEAFRRAESADSSGQRGWGLGLTLVKGLAEAHHGSVSVESEESSGTTFTVKLPITR